ncbi:MAG: hypothetical protein CSA42_08050 [Gammaproteobacteria bacterium]|nr:MAG: hypothetical protein CSA42_08050 [Gammaproteobacteria bacterium]
MNNRENYEGYFIAPWEFGHGKVMVLTGSWEKAYSKIIGSQKIFALRLSESAGWKSDDLSFVAELTQLRGIEIYSWKVKDIKPIQDLINIESIGLQCEFEEQIDFSVFNNLIDCHLMWRPKCESLFSCTSLKTLNIDKYPYQDFIGLKSLTLLERLQITSRKLESVKGIEELAELKILDLFNCPKLSSLHGIENLASFHTLELENCKKIDDLNTISNHNQIEKIVLNSCGKIKTLSPIESCKNLKELTFIENTVIEDGNLTLFNRLPNLKKMLFANRKHYSHSCEEIKDILEKRR